MPRKKLLQKIDTIGNTQDLGNTISDDDLNKIDNLKTVATTGSYNDLSNKPSIPTIVTLTQAEYDALTPDENTIYLIKEE